MTLILLDANISLLNQFYNEFLTYSNDGENLFYMCLKNVDLFILLIIVSVSLECNR